MILEKEKIKNAKHIIDVIGPYQVLSQNEVKEIKHPSQIFMNKIKNPSPETIFNFPEKNVLNLFKKKLEEMIEWSNNIAGKRVFIVVPPTKEGKDNQVQSLLSFLKIVGEYETIEFSSANYKTKGKSASERKMMFESIYKTWTLDFKPWVSSTGEESFLIFVDDLLTTGATASYTIRAVKETYGIDNKINFRCIYLMGTKAYSGYEEKNKFLLKDIWLK